MQKIREELILKLCRTFSNDEINLILDQLDGVLLNYTVQEKSGLPACSDNFTILEKFFKAKIIEGMSMNSIKTYTSILKDYCRLVGKPIIYVTAQDIRNYLGYIKDTRNISGCSLEHRRNVINSLYLWLLREGYITANPCFKVNRIKYEKKLREPLTHEQMNAIRYACRNNLRDAALVEFMYSSGCRVSEVVGIKLTDIDFNRNRVKVKGKGNKNDYVPMSADAKSMIIRYLNSRTNNTDYLFSHNKKLGNKPMTTDSIRDIYIKLAKKAGLDIKIFPHKIRHTTATHLLEGGMKVENVQKILRHSDIGTTMIYADVNQDIVEMEYKRCFGQ